MQNLVTFDIQDDCSGYYDTSLVFPDAKTACDWAKEVSLSLRFELIIGGNKQNKKKMVCNRWKTPADEAPLPQIRKNTHRLGCGCKFLLWVREVHNPNGWSIQIPKKMEQRMHNHPPILYPEGHRQLSGLSNASKQLVKKLNNSHVKAKSMLDAVNLENPDDHATRRHIYNETAKLRKDGFEGRNIATQFLHIATQNEYVLKIQHNEETGALTHIFMAHPKSVELLNTYHWILVVDSTYKTNRYHMPLFEIVGVTPCNKNFNVAYAIIKDETERSYGWVMSQLRMLFNPGLEPTVIVSDRELGLMNPIKDNFPHSHHLLCRWHIKMDVLKMLTKLLGGNKIDAEDITDGRWKRVMEAPTIAAYEYSLRVLRDEFENSRPKIVEYLESIWLVHKEKFVFAWTNKILHFGNTTTCRVESSHAALKDWLYASTGSLDTLWSKIHKQLGDQYKHIRASLEFSRSKTPTTSIGFPFSLLNCKVSHRCITLLRAEWKRMKDLGNEVTQKCGCVKRTTHQFPCACELKTLHDTKTMISVNVVHPFWQNLEIGKVSEIRTNGLSEDHSHFLSLASDVANRPRTMVRRLNLMIEQELYPEQRDVCEPDIDDASQRGRPRLNASVRRNLSAWERSGSRRGARGRGRCNNRGHPQSNDRSTSPVRTGNRTVIGEPIVAGSIPRFLKDYCLGCTNVESDGNCGFRVVADHVYSDEQQWRVVRQGIVDELLVARHMYTQIYTAWGPTNQDIMGAIDRQITRITWNGLGCGSNHWMMTPEDLFPIATWAKAIVIIIYPNLAGCWTILPLCAQEDATQPEKEIVISHLGSIDHYVRLHLAANAPIPPIHPLWRRNRDDTVIDWDVPYRHRILLWETRRPNQ